EGSASPLRVLFQLSAVAMALATVRTPRRPRNSQTVSAMIERPQMFRVEVEQCLPRPVQKGMAVFAGFEDDGLTEDDAAKQRHRQECTFRQHTRHVLDPAGNEFHIRTGEGEIVETGAEAQKRLLSHVT